ncbi:hypothetical protein [uncultured Wocania sp.]|uniref:hypothetical protein n=1 Tax=uncultured Wocania sp. TaxID=2834404 RepID=UPI0030F6D1A5
MCNFKRREFIKLNALGFAAIALQLSTVSSYAQQANGYLGKLGTNTKLNWDAFLEKITQLSQSQHQLPWDQKMYTQKVKQLLLQCNFPEFENVKREMDNYENKNLKWFEASSLHHEVDFQISLFQFEKGEYIPHHDHPDMTGVINVVSGSAHLRNYNRIEELGSRTVTTNGQKIIKQSCILKEVSNQIAKTGDVSILTSNDGNIHSVMPNEFTQLVDVFTPAYTENTNPKWYKVDEEEFYKQQEKLFVAEYY